MTPEEKYHTDRWFVLQKIKELELYAPNKNEISYRLEITPYSQFEKHSPSAQINILKQLADEKVIEILDEQKASGYGAYYLFVFKIKRPKFDDIYQSYENQHRAEGERLGVGESPKNNIQILADQLNKDFADDKQNVQIARAWFEALANGAKPADGKTELEGFQTMVAQTLINLEPFRRRLAENAKVINQISQNLIMPNLEAVKPMLKEIEDSLGRVSRFYNPPQNLTITSPLPPKISETIERGEIMKEIRALRNEVERLTDKLGDASRNKLDNAKVAIVVPVKDARLDERNYYLELNGGDTIISFKSKKSGNGLDKETKQFKILYQLWDFRWELKNGTVLKKGDYSSLINLATASKSESTNAAYKHIQRLNDRFKKAGVAIEINGENEKYRLVINKT